MVDTVKHGFFVHMNCSRFTNCRFLRHGFFANGQICIIYVDVYIQGVAIHLSPPSTAQPKSLTI